MRYIYIVLVVLFIGFIGYYYGYPYYKYKEIYNIAIEQYPALNKPIQEIKLPIIEQEGLQKMEFGGLSVYIPSNLFCESGNESLFLKVFDCYKQSTMEGESGGIIISKNDDNYKIFDYFPFVSLEIFKEMKVNNEYEFYKRALSTDYKKVNVFTNNREKVLHSITLTYIQTSIPAHSDVKTINHPNFKGFMFEGSSLPLARIFDNNGNWRYDVIWGRVHTEVINYDDMLNILGTIEF
jgi:hypothetical protein